MLMFAMQVTLDMVEVVLALKDDGTGQHEHGEGLKETVQQAAAGLLLLCVHADTCACLPAIAIRGLRLVPRCELWWPAAAVSATVGAHDGRTVPTIVTPGTALWFAPVML